MLKEKIQGFIEKMMAVEGVAGCALISRDGIMLGRSLPGECNEPWLAAMSATLFASAESASSILKLPLPEGVTISAEDSTLQVIGAGEKLLVVIVIRRGAERALVPERLQALVKEIGGAF
ncbi:MAG: roadblock/LC7 domain-containing protein [Methanolinea sp.]|nr:roadblock/LC7 domain-containing protein [Methanolinea sp.]